MSSQTDGAPTEVSSPWPASTGVSRTELDPTSFLYRSAGVHPDRVAVGVRRLAAHLRRAARAGEPAGLGAAGAGARAPRPRGRAVSERARAAGAPPRGAGGRRVLVAINVRLGAGEVGYILEHSGSRVLFADPELESLAAEAPAGLEVVRLGDEYERLVASGDPAGVPSLLRDEEEPIAIDHTAGTTGRPKGVVYTYRRGVPQRARRGDRGRARPPPGLPVDAAHVPLQWLVLPVGGDGSRGHARVPAGGRPELIWRLRTAGRTCRRRSARAAWPGRARATRPRTSSAWSTRRCETCRATARRWARS
jgi:hypothetical protein